MEIKNEINKLAEMMQREFRVMNSKIDNLESKMNGKIDNLESKMDGKIDGLESKMNGKIDGLESKMDERFDLVDERFDEVLNREDKIFKRLEDLETDNTMSAGVSRRQEDKLENHEERIIVAEEKLGIGEAV